MSNCSIVVMQTNDYWTTDDWISGLNVATREEEWLQILPDNPAELIGCTSDQDCSGVDELIRFNDQLYIVQNIDLEEVPYGSNSNLFEM